MFPLKAKKERHSAPHRSAKIQNVISKLKPVMKFITAIVSGHNVH